MPKGYKTLGLTLGGGGTKGFAHIGFYKALFENKIPIHSIAGSSIGALIGACIAQKKDPDEILRVMAEFASDTESFFRIGNFSIDKGGILKGDKEMETLERLIPKDLTFEDLPIPLVVNAVDLEKGTQVAFKTGNVFMAVRASMSIPGVFTPVFYQNKLLVDGGVLNDIPVDLCRELGAEVQVAVDLRSFYSEQNISGLIYHFYLQNDQEKKTGVKLPKQILQEAKLKVTFPLTILLRSVCIAEEAYREKMLKEYKPDLLIHPDVTAYSFLDTTEYLAIYGKGLEAGEKALPKIRSAILN